MNIRKVIESRIRRRGGGVDAVGDVNAVVAANVDEGSTRTHVSTRSRQRIVQRSGRTEVAGGRKTPRQGGDDEPAGRIPIEADEAGEPNPNGTSERPEPPTAPIDEDVKESVNAALPDADE